MTTDPLAPPPEPMSLRRAGIWATAVALALLWVLSGIGDSIVFPPTSLAGALVRETPGDVATFFIELLGHWALRLATLGALAGAVALGVGALLATRRGERVHPFRAGAVLAVAAGAAAAIEPSAEVRLIPMAIALIAAAGVFGVVASGLLRKRLVPGPGEASDPGRRTALRLGVGGVAALTLGGGVVGWFLRRVGGPDRNVAIAEAVATPTVPPDPAFPQVAGLSSEITSVAEHYTVDVNLVQPTVEAEGWTLPVKGEVDVPLELDFASMQEEFEVVEDFSVLSCISNPVGGPLVGHSAWRGIRLKEVLERAIPRDGAVDVVFTAADGYTDSIPMEVALDPAVLLAIAQNGQPLTREHGFPCRVRVPAIYGMKNVKWVQSIEVVARDYKGYWMKRGWSDVARVKTQSRIDVAGSDGAASVGDETWIAGVAWAGDRGIQRVEVSVDGDTWEEAQLKEPANDETSWRLWAYAWTPGESGSYTVLCRAVDGDGEMQIAEEAPPHPSGASGYHAMTVEVS